MTTKEKIIQYLDYRDISQGKFCRKIGVSNGFLTSGKHIGSEKLKDIRDNYLDLNMNWLIYDEGDMIIDDYYVPNVASEPSPSYDIDERIKAVIKEIVDPELVSINKDILVLFRRSLDMSAEQMRDIKSQTS